VQVDRNRVKGTVPGAVVINLCKLHGRECLQIAGSREALYWGAVIRGIHPVPENRLREIPLVL
ncbi:MAG TPA: hypothetical protein VEN78_17675, partial [Bradyrhizobium sp.]|nr:hypothetical protein [Bradyrhizobium sp.]